MKCHCGHEEDEHFAAGEDKKFPGSTRCDVDGCDCIAYEENDEDD